MYASFGRHGLFAFDFNGKIVWHHKFGILDNYHGPAGSPVLYKDRVFIYQDANPAPGQTAFVGAFDKATGKVLAVASVAWSVPPRQTNIVPVDSGAVAFASGTLEATTASGAPKRYTVAPDDLIDVVAQRFGISVSALLFMNQGLQVIDDAQHLFEGTTLVLDPDSV